MKLLLLFFRVVYFVVSKSHGFRFSTLHVAKFSQSTTLNIKYQISNNICSLSTENARYMTCNVHKNLFEMKKKKMRIQFVRTLLSRHKLWVGYWSQVTITNFPLISCNIFFIVHNLVFWQITPKASYSNVAMVTPFMKNNIPTEESYSSSFAEENSDFTTVKRKKAVSNTFSVCFFILCHSYRNFDRYSIRSSHQRCSAEIGVLKNFTKFTGKYLCQSLSFNNVAGLRLLAKKLWHRCFPVNFVKFLRTSLLQNTSKRLLLECVFFVL